MKWTRWNRCSDALLIVGIYTSEGQSRMLDASLGCDVCCIPGIEGPLLCLRDNSGRGYAISVGHQATIRTFIQRAIKDGLPDI